MSMHRQGKRIAMLFLSDSESIILVRDTEENRYYVLLRKLDESNGNENEEEVASSENLYEAIDKAHDKLRSKALSEFENAFIELLYGNESVRDRVRDLIDKIVSIDVAFDRLRQEAKLYSEIVGQEET